MVHRRLHQTEELRTAVVFASPAEIVRAVEGSESSVVCSAFVLIFLFFFFFFFFLSFFFPFVGLEYGAVDEDDGREKGKKESKCFEEDGADCLF